MKALSARRRSKGGRPRKAAPRHACGKLVQSAEPNPKVVALRRALVGSAGTGDARADLASAEDPMSLALARGWITEAQHRAGVAYAQAWRRSHPQRRLVGETSEAPEPAVRDLRRIGEMGDAEIARAFDAMLEGTRLAPREESEVEARTRYNAASRLMRPAEQNEVFLCFCLQSWPQWLIQRCAGHFDTPWEARRRLLVAGLDAIAERRRGRAGAA
jgi:hypothetical protein